ncbi:hypothetical protein CY34DRAFT_151291 [Suillus luteus UH-Slu-Lm8-n1]|uniref:Uncharacterized protein n=1 Tax=Suillus luteus UH-Slu-Lm8-n1 TaxID=930992 RepID=A0A0D0B7C2_9AGAM|nr:hypothetical protein CY34DRAFT_151291 [Suillus luteus UH-Slu-Lm8-n1]
MYSYWLVHVPVKYLPIPPVFRLLSDTDHLPLGTTVIDANGQCTQYYHGGSLTGHRRMYGPSFIWPSPSTDDFEIFYGLTYLAQHVIAWSDALSFDLLTLGLVSITNIYVRTYLILCFALTVMLTTSMRTTLHSENAGMNDAFEYRGQCFINSLQVDLRPSDLKVPFSSLSAHRPAYLISLSCSFHDKGEPRPGVHAIYSFSFTVAQIDKLSQTNELSAIGAAHFANISFSYVCSDSRTPRTRRTNCVSNLYYILLYLRTEHGGLHCKHSG